MPGVNIPLVDTERTILMPVTFSILKQIKEMLNIPDSVTVSVPSSTTDFNLCSITGDTIKDKSSVYGNMRITVEEQQEPATLNTMATYGLKTLPIINDPDHGFSIYPINATTTLSINITYYAKDKTMLTNWLNNIKIKFAQDARQLYHTLELRYPFPVQFFNLIKTIHQLQENVSPYNRSLKEYINAVSTNRLVFASDSEAINLDILVKDTRHRVMGTYDFDLPSNKIEYDKDTAKWSVEFSYKVTYDKPIALHADYPVMVHQQLIPPEYLTEYSVMSEIDEISIPRDSQMNSAKLFEVTLIDRCYREEKPVIVPLADDFEYTNKIPYLRPLIALLCQITESDKRTLFNLEEMEYVKLDNTIIEWLRGGESAYITKTLASFIQLTLYEGNTESRIPISVDNNLNVVAGVDLDLRKVYRVVISLVKDCNMLNSRAIKTLSEAMKDTISNAIEEREISYPVFGLMRGGLFKKGDCFNRANMLKTIQVTDIIALRPEMFHVSS